jgi:hypothetical protein
VVLMADHGGMAGPVQHFAEIPLTDVFPNLTAETSAQLIRTGERLDTARPAVDSGGWDWYPQNVPPATKYPSGVTLLLISTEVTLFNDRVDSLELALYIGWSVPPLLVVSAGIEVACWCPTYHNMHPVRCTEWVVGTSQALVGAFDAAISDIISSLDGSPDPSTWRAQAGLPPRT